MIEKVKITIERIKELNLRTLRNWEYILIILLFCDTFFFYWYLELKVLAMAFLFPLLLLITGILILEKRQLDMNPKQKSKSDSKKGYKMDFDLGLPNSEEINKRFDEALGF